MHHWTEFDGLILSLRSRAKVPFVVVPNSTSKRINDTAYYRCNVVRLHGATIKIEYNLGNQTFAELNSNVFGILLHIICAFLVMSTNPYEIIISAKTLAYKTIENLGTSKSDLHFLWNFLSSIRKWKNV